MTFPKWVACDVELDVPDDVAVCPCCRAQLLASMNTYSQASDGTWSASSVLCRCTRTPDLDDEDELDAWLEIHGTWSQAYMALVEAKVLEWVNSHYRFHFGFDHKGR